MVTFFFWSAVESLGLPVRLRPVGVGVDEFAFEA